MSQINNEKRRRESYECLYGLRFPNAKVFDTPDSEAAYNDSSDSSKNLPMNGKLLLLLQKH